MVSPVYLAETSPPAIRGRLAGIFTMEMVIGNLAGALIGAALVPNWKLMFVLGMIPPLVIVLGMLFRPESPMWLLKMGRQQEAREVISKNYEINNSSFSE